MSAFLHAVSGDRLGAVYAVTLLLALRPSEALDWPRLERWLRVDACQGR